MRAREMFQKLPFMKQGENGDKGIKEERESTRYFAVRQ